jgi:hypothetical protein
MVYKYRGQTQTQHGGPVDFFQTFIFINRKVVRQVVNVWRTTTLNLQFSRELFQSSKIANLTGQYETRSEIDGAMGDNVIYWWCSEKSTENMRPSHDDHDKMMMMN